MGPHATSLLAICVFTTFCLVVRFANASARSEESPHVCIVGAGIGGASAAHFLAEGNDGAVRVTVFERNAQVGGRIANMQMGDGSVVEAGASIIASRNRLMSHFASLLNLSRRVGDDSKGLGLWDGHFFRFRTSSVGAFTILKMLLRYRMSVLRMRRLISLLIERFDKLYPAHWHVSSIVGAIDICKMFTPVKLYELTQVQFGEYTADTLSVRFMDEIVAAISRCNYNQEPGGMNALSGAISLAGSGDELWSVRGGNVLIVQGLLERSTAKVVLTKNVAKVKRASGGGYLLMNDDGDVSSCDGVILAAPLELTDIELPDDIATRANVQRKFALTVATFVQGVLSENTFGAEMPQAILTTANATCLSKNNASKSNAEICVSPFNSVARVHRFINGTAIYKVFSGKELTDADLESLFEPGAHVIATYPWYAYPKFTPPERFAPFELDKDGALCYTSPIESAGSAMEMSALSGANCAALVWSKLELGKKKEGTLAATGPKEEL